MNITKWSKNDIMQLPDHFFGRRWWTGTRLSLETGTVGFAIAEEGLPEYCILWQIYASTTRSVATVRTTLDLRLGSRLPADNAQFDALDRLVTGFGVATLREPFYLNQFAPLYLTNQRILIHAKGRRLVVRILNISGDEAWYTVNILVSSLPKHLPDKLLHPPLEQTENFLKQIWQRIKL